VSAVNIVLTAFPVGFWAVLKKEKEFIHLYELNDLGFNSRMGGTVFSVFQLSVTYHKYLSVHTLQHLLCTRGAVLVLVNRCSWNKIQITFFILMSGTSPFSTSNTSSVDFFT
jgi:hypothetical protein